MGGDGGWVEDVATSRPAAGVRGEIGGDEAAASSGSVGEVVAAFWGDVAMVLNPVVTPEV